jgi:cytochrome b subunit of formate dehydrogenase
LQIIVIFGFILLVILFLHFLIGEMFQWEYLVCTILFHFVLHNFLTRKDVVWTKKDYYKMEMV